MHIENLLEPVRQRLALQKPANTAVDGKKPLMLSSMLSSAAAFCRWLTLTLPTLPTTSALDLLRMPVMLGRRAYREF
jgi:hypothetical protein